MHYFHVLKRTEEVLGQDVYDASCILIVLYISAVHDRAVEWNKRERSQFRGSQGRESKSYAVHEECFDVFMFQYKEIQQQEFAE